MRFFFPIISLSEGDGATAAAGAKGAPPKDPLPKVPCLEALAELRHAKWFQVCVVIFEMGLENYLANFIATGRKKW
uniref:Bm12614 n=1 Tax=Brugia malayi TaxID=6279 RepID=A0A1I9GBH4_BRUMA|nr:Bm12614 [Brugia malayi]